MKKLFYSASFYMFLGLLFGVFYREFTKINNYSGITQLSTLHTHTLILGMFFFLIVLTLEKVFSLSSNKSFGKWIVFYHVTLLGVLATMTVRGIYQVNGMDFVGLNHIAGLTHTLYAIAIVWFFLLLKKKI
ncbi:DUF2871 domain-containing protein [Fusibacter bizertensis]